MKPAAPDGSHAGEDGSAGDRREERRALQLVYLREPPGLAPPPLTRWQGVAVVLFILSFPALLLLVWWLVSGR